MVTIMVTRCDHKFNGMYKVFSMKRNVILTFMVVEQLLAGRLCGVLGSRFLSVTRDLFGYSDIRLSVAP